MARNLGTLLERCDLDPPNRLETTALIDLHAGERTYSYRDMVDAANAVANGLIRRNIHRGSRVAILSSNRHEMLSVIFGALRAGVIPVPINFRVGPETLAHIFSDSGVSMAFCDEAGKEGPRKLGVPVVCFDDESLNDFLSPGEFAPVAVDSESIALQLYTSGSTGMPKGVLLSHEGQYWASVVYDRFREPMGSMRILTAAPLYHMNALFMSQFAFAANATLVMLPKFTPATFADAIDRYHIDYVSGVPTMLAKLAAEPDVIAGKHLESVSVVGLGSAPLTDALVQEIEQLFPNCTISNGYGTTEAGPTIFGPHPGGIPRPNLSLGYPLPDIEVRLVGGPHDNEGTLVLKSPALTKGYHNLAAKTRERIVDGWYDTGDVVRRDADGFFFFVGRADDMFVCSGENIYPAEVEKMLDNHPDILQSAVVPLDDHVRGAIPIAFVVVQEGKTLDEENVKRHALLNGPPHQHPRSVHFVHELPLTGVNKVDRKQLVQWAAALP